MCNRIAVLAASLGLVWSSFIAGCTEANPVAPTAQRSLAATYGGPGADQPPLPQDLDPSEITVVRYINEGTYSSVWLVEARGQQYAVVVPMTLAEGAPEEISVGDVMRLIPQPEFGGPPNGGTSVTLEI